MRNKLSKFYNRQETYDRAFRAIVVDYDTHTATDPNEVPRAELGANMRGTYSRQREVGARIASALFVTSLDSSLVDFSVSRASLASGVPVEEVDVAVASHLVGLSAEIYAEIHGTND